MIGVTMTWKLSEDRKNWKQCECCGKYAVQARRVNIWRGLRVREGQQIQFASWKLQEVYNPVRGTTLSSWTFKCLHQTPEEAYSWCERDKSVL